jgi:hypothetical protein
MDFNAFKLIKLINDYMIENDPVHKNITLTIDDRLVNKFNETYNERISLNYANKIANYCCENRLLKIKDRGNGEKDLALTQRGQKFVQSRLHQIAKKEQNLKSYLAITRIIQNSLKDI